MRELAAAPWAAAVRSPPLSWQATFYIARGGSNGFGTSIVLIAAGAILRFAVSVTTTGFNLHSIGLILMIVGVLALVLSIVFWSSWADSVC